MNAFRPHDPFREKRVRDGVLNNDFKGELIPMILRHADVRDAAKDWEKFSSDAPFRVPIPSEEDVRGVRQLPIETDPSDHTDYRAIVEPFLRRALKPEVAAHYCLGAHHARLIMRSLISALCKNAGRMECLEARDHVEREAGYQRKSGYEALVVRFAGRNVGVSA